MHCHRVQGLKEAAHTKIGNALIRGVSGGQKRRVTVGEACILNSRILALDGPTNGLDSVTANAVCKYVADWAHHTQGIAIATLQQPQPETFALFDEVILLAEGRVLYHGPTAYMDGEGGGTVGSSNTVNRTAALRCCAVCWPL
jgi:ABC-type multidrug transport system ATPase subunit